MILYGQDKACIDWRGTLNAPTLIKSDDLMPFDVVLRQSGV